MSQMNHSCESYDWKAYALGELPPPAQREAGAHAAACPRCREELATLRLTLDTLSTLREEEIPRRIAFVSDKVFEPRWWQNLLSPNFAAACVIAAAILVHAFVGFAAPSQAVIQSQVDAAVTTAVAQVEVQQAEQTADMAAAYDRLDKQFRQVIKQVYFSSTGTVRQ
jgi:anti-sigma factor RsiW